MTRKCLVGALLVLAGVAALSWAALSWAAEEGKKVIVLETSLGQLHLELDAAKAPQTVENFLSYVKDGFYNGTVFHRVVQGFVIQGGGLTEAMKEKQTRKPIRNEAANGLTNEPYTVAMARTNDPHSATSQFFINLAANGFLNHKAKTPDGWGYCVFGKVVEGREVVDAIAAVPTGTKGPHSDVPKKPVTILKAYVLDQPQ